MSVDEAVRRAASMIERTTSRTFPVRPIARVLGPRIELTSGDPDRYFFTASVDKVFIATLVAQLMDSGRVTPESPLGALLPARDIRSLPAAAGVDNARHVTIDHLLSHTSGLPDVMLPPRGHDTTCSIANLSARPRHTWTLDELLEQAGHLPPSARPGERFLYSDTGYFLLIRIIEESSGTDFVSRLRTRILEPAGMADTAAWVGADASEVDRLSRRLDPFWLSDPRTPLHRDFAGNLTGSNGLGWASTAHDLIRFQEALHEGRLCDSARLSYLGAPRNRFRRGIHYGSGMATLRFGEFFPLLRGHPHPAGGLGYTASHMFYYPAQRTHVVLNYHAHRRMNASFQMHIRLAGLIRRYG